MPKIHFSFSFDTLVFTEAVDFLSRLLSYNRNIVGFNSKNRVWPSGRFFFRILVRM